MDYIPKFIDETKQKSKEKNVRQPAKFERALANFLEYIKNQRKDHYARFVQLWEENQKQEFFDNFRETTKGWS